ncbi:MAG: hypothetical protein AB8B71_15755 [Paracoccaceae bacterium]
MAHPQKIATCCYCGTRAALVLKGKQRHELACSNCGAPLHDLKMLPKDRTRDAELVDRPKHMSFKTKKAPKSYKKRKKRKGFMKEFFEEAFDLIEDIFD